jgi:CHAT domain-containing protein
MEDVGVGPDVVQAANVERLVESARQQLHVDRQRSLALAAAGEVIARRLDDARLIGLCLRAQGNALWASGDHATAIDRHDRARQLFESVGDEGEVARTLNAAIQPLILLGRYDEALRAGSDARVIFARAGDEVRLARLDINLGNILHRQDRFDEALEAYERAGERVRALGDLDGCVTALHNKAVTLTSLMRFREALEMYEVGRALSVEHAMPLKVAQIDYNVAWLYYLRGEYARAIDLLLATARTSDRDDRYHAALCRLDLSEIYLEVGLDDEARELAEQAHAMFVEMGSRYESAKALANVAIAEGRQGRVERALELFQAAQAGFIEERNYAWPSLTDLYRATLLFQEGRIAEARGLAQAALDFFGQSSLKTKTALCHLLLARISLAERDFAGAGECCRRAKAYLEGLEAPALNYEAHLVTGQVCAGSGDGDGAYHCYQLARCEVEVLRGWLRGDELKIAFGRNKLELYEHLVSLCLEDANPRRHEEAFNHVEQAKCRSLLDLIVRPLGAPADGSDQRRPVLARIRALRNELNWYYHLTDREALQPGRPDRARVERLQRELAGREKELARLIRDLPATDAGSTASMTVTLQEIRDALPEHAVLLEYFQAQNQIILFAVWRNKLRVVPLCSAARLQERVQWLQFQIEKVRIGPAYARTFEPLLLDSVRAHLKALHDDLLSPIWNDIKGGHLVVVPHGFLHYVPFHALFDGHRYVVDRCTVSYAPSASVYALAGRSRPAASGQSLVLSVPDERAPLIAAEAEEVAAVLPCASLFVGSDATGEVLRSHGRCSRVIHIASHGLFRPDSPMFSGIRLGDGYLTGYDLASLTLPAALVTLSGCATGRGVAEAGDEILGISRGLFCAGARSLLLSLWDVHDESTTHFMTSFYRALFDAGDMAEAARVAMLEVKARQPHPYYWAPFALIGQFRDWA